MKNKKAIALIILSMITLVALVTVGTYAYFNSITTSENNTFAAGTVDISLYRDDVPFYGPMFYSFAGEGISGMKPTGYWYPGKTETRGAIISNEGTLNAKLAGIGVWITDSNGNFVAPNARVGDIKKTYDWTKQCGVKYTFLRFNKDKSNFTQSGYEQALAALNEAYAGMDLPEALTEEQEAEIMAQLNRMNLNDYSVISIYSDEWLTKCIDRCASGFTEFKAVGMNSGDYQKLLADENTYVAVTIKWYDNKQYGNPASIDHNQYQELKTSPIKFGFLYKQD